ncbi:helix-turn-helix domain-containing protein [Kocuria rosea]|uniref:helix-turn-helix domain-containing protein n=1 Tax=Kocuria rosea TaxID=1275 RepID=UPI00203E0B2E|nr:helix-turn-helix domain-containing protein [Kocuria rosea]MCM3689059.1 helix-turn-helix domain-containing protein [Kocuria rosea]
MEVTIAEAATRLGVSPRQAQRLAQQGQLQIVRRVGRTLLVEDTAITQRHQTGRGPGRRWNSNTAWAAIELLEHGWTTRAAARTLFRLKGRLASLSVEEFVRLAAGRAQTQRMTQTRRRPAALKDALMLSGRSALDNPQVAARFGLAGGESQIIEGYLHQDELEEVLTRFGLVADAEGEVFLHISEEVPVDSIITTALDLVERGTTRERAAAHGLLQAALDQ